MTIFRHATSDLALHAVVTSRRALVYAAGGDASVDRPAHVRAASSLAWIGDQIALVQDDANFVALVDPLGGEARVIALPRGEGGLRQFDDERGNKKFKLDLEACVAVDGDDGPLLLAFGSGSTKRRRQVGMIDRWDDAKPRVIVADATSLYQCLESEPAFAGSDMNIEGTLIVDNALRFFGRGNGKARGNLSAVNATCDVPLDELLRYLRHPARREPPKPTNVVQYQLGTLQGIALGFTDATVMGNDVVFSATAEASDTAVDDGEVAGSVIGVITRSGRTRHAVLTDHAGQPLVDKVEGVLLSRTSTTRAYIVIDADDHTRPSELCEVQLSGLWND